MNTRTKNKSRLLSMMMALLVVFAVVFTMGSTTLIASAATNVNSKAYRYDHYIEDTGTFKRDRVYYINVYEYDTLVYNVPLKALHSGLDIQTKTSFSLTKESTISSSYSATETIGAKLSSKYGSSAEADIEMVKAKLYNEFAAEFSATYSNTITRTVSEKTVVTQNYNITDPADYGFYTVTLKAYTAQKYLITISWYEYTCERENTKSDWSEWKQVENGYYSTNYYIPTTSSTYVSFEKYDSATDYASYMDKYHAIY